MGNDLKVVVVARMRTAPQPKLSWPLSPRIDAAESRVSFSPRKYRFRTPLKIKEPYTFY